MDVTFLLKQLFCFFFVQLKESRLEKEDAIITVELLQSGEEEHSVELAGSLFGFPVN